MADVDEALAGADRIRTDDNALQNTVGVGLNDAAILECARVAFIWRCR